MGLQIDWYNHIIQIISPTTSVDAQVLHDFIEDAMASPRGMTEADIINPEGKIEDPSNPGVFSQIIIIINSPWQIQFWGGSGYTRIFGGKIVGGLADEPFKATGTAGDISVLESPVDGLTVVVETGTSGLTSEEADALLLMSDIEGGRWMIDEGTNQMIIYKADNVTEVARFDLLDENGSPTSDPTRIAERVRV